MRFIYILEALFILLVAAFVITQLIFPVCYGKPVFPAFRWKKRFLEHEIAEEIGTAEDQELLRQLAEQKRKNQGAQAPSEKPQPKAETKQSSQRKKK
jgi:hypothetical protein